MGVWKSINYLIEINNLGGKFMYLLKNNSYYTAQDREPFTGEVDSSYPIVEGIDRKYITAGEKVWLPIKYYNTKNKENLSSQEYYLQNLFHKILQVEIDDNNVGNDKAIIYFDRLLHKPATEEEFLQLTMELFNDEEVSLSDILSVARDRAPECDPFDNDRFIINLFTFQREEGGERIMPALLDWASVSSKGGQFSDALGVSNEYYSEKIANMEALVVEDNDTEYYTKAIAEEIEDFPATAYPVKEEITVEEEVVTEEAAVVDIVDEPDLIAPIEYREEDVIVNDLEGAVEANGFNLEAENDSLMANAAEEALQNLPEVEDEPYVPDPLEALLNDTSEEIPVKEDNFETAKANLFERSLDEMIESLNESKSTAVDPKNIVYTPEEFTLESTLEFKNTVVQVGKYTVHLSIDENGNLLQKIDINEGE